MEGVGRQGQGVREEADDELEEEENRVKRDHDLDAGGLGPRQLEAAAEHDGVVRTQRRRARDCYYG